MVLSPLSWTGPEVQPLQVGSAMFSWNCCRGQQPQAALAHPTASFHFQCLCCRASRGAWGHGERRAWTVSQGQR